MNSFVLLKAPPPKKKGLLEETRYRALTRTEMRSRK